jgi:hypothetical protein
MSPDGETTKERIKKPEASSNTNEAAREAHAGGEKAKRFRLGIRTDVARAG